MNFAVYMVFYYKSVHGAGKKTKGWTISSFDILFLNTINILIIVDKIKL